MITKLAHLTSVWHNVTSWAVWVCQMQGRAYNNAYLLFGIESQNFTMRRTDPDFFELRV